MALMTTEAVILNLGLRNLEPWEVSQLDFCRSASEAFLEQQIGRKLAKTRRTEYYAGTGQRTFHLKHRPVWEIHNLWMDAYGFYGVPTGSFDNSTTLLVQGTDYVLDQDQPTPAVAGDSYLSRSGVVLRQRTIWSEVPRNYVPGRVSTEVSPVWGNIKVDYTAGFDPIPDDIKLAICMMASLYKRILPHGQLLESERIGDYSYSILTGRMMMQTHPVIGSLDRLINKYREVAI